MSYKKLIVLSVITSLTLAQASWEEMGKNILTNVSKDALPTTTTAKTSNLTNTEMTNGLKEALQQGATKAIKELSTNNGYMNNALTKIELPNNLKAAEMAIRKIGGNQYADELITAMNQSASQAAPKAATIFSNAIQKMNITDVNKIIQGDNTAATDYFKDTTMSDLKMALLPIIKQSMDQNQIATYYKAFQSYYKTSASALPDTSSLNNLAKSFKMDSYIPNNNSEVELDDYITTKAIEGMFSLIEKEEQAIRANPMQQSSSLLKKVFGN
jgi:hypothetical protein